MEDGEYTREDWFIDEDEHLPWWMCILSWVILTVIIIAAGSCLFYLAMGIREAIGV
jgi:hypothetical protein